jgi:archaeosine-15-forming tRNA-guanine transglycosylase
MVVSDEAVPFVARGGRIYPMHLIRVDPEIRTGEMVRIVDNKDRTLATACAVFTAEDLQRFKIGTDS